MKKNQDHLVALPTANSGMGMIVPRQLGGLLKLDMKKDIAGPVVGAGGAVLGIFLARRYGNKLVKSGALANTYPELGGAVVGSLLSVPLYYWSRDPKMVASGILTAVITSAAVYGARKAVEKAASLEAAALAAGAGTSGLGMLTAQQTRGLVMQRAVGALPAARMRGGMPQIVRQGLNRSVYGKVI